MAQEFNIVGNLLLKVDGAEAGLNKLKNSLSKLEMPKGLENSFKKSFSNLDTILARYKSQIEKGFDTKADVTAFAKTGKALDAELNRISKHFTELTGKEINFRVNSDEIIQTEKELQKLIEQKEQLGKDSLKFNIDGTKDGYKDIEALLNKLKEVGEKTKTGEYASNALDFLKTGNIQGAITQLDKAAVSCKRFGEEKQKAFQETGFNIGSAIQLIIQQLSGAEGKIGAVNTAISGTQDKLNNLQAEQIEKAGSYAEKLSNDFNESNTAIRQADGAMQDFARSSQSMAEQVKQLQQSTQYFFGLRNMLNLFKRGIREAVQTVKELDKAMTETAVVTDFSVGDMWAKLPEYTANANKLGATVQDMYEATTLYYQQGLNSQQAMEIAGETMKMARIGGLEAAEATDMMTAALRGFNMELNETSAQRINDVYSNLAAKTASNTEELGTAMQRTASIAASAGMSFEGTAAFLAQAIETTREPAENLGTAMKTIVARFTELKKNPLEIAEVDGEEISYNKVDAALQSIGVSLKDANGQFRDLDQVFLDISERWNGLSQTQQRYIATIAAGSRQQSRFIAMMSNYERTTQLMEYANNANGASNEQFGKTLDSLEAKLNKFQNAWKEFLMGIMNDSWTKGIVGAGTTILGIVNKLIDALSFGGKAKGIQSFLSLFMAFKGLKLAGRGANALIGGLAGSLDPKSSFGQGFKNGILGGAKNEISQATSRIEKAIYSLIPHIDKEATNATNQYKFQDSGQYNQARKELINNLGGHLGQIKRGKGTYTAGSLLDIIDSNQLNKQQQKQFFQASPGLKRNLTKSLTKLYEEVGTDKKTTEALTSGFKNGDLGLEEALLGNDKLSTSFANAYQKLSEEGNQKAATKLLMKHTNELLQTGKNQGLQGKDLQDFVAKNLSNKRVLNQAGLDFLQNPQVLTTSEKFANIAGQIGAGFMSAGSAVQMFGAQVSQVNPIVGQAISNFGGLLTTAGSLANVIPTIVGGGPVAWGIAAAVTAIGGLTIGFKVHAENIKKKGQEVVDTYNNVSDELKNSIDNIKGYQNELIQLSTGVDENGFNVSLDDSEYQRYQELVNDLVQQNPEIVKGWNSEGKAIINVNEALKDTIKLKQQDLAAEKEKYLSDISGQQLINARNATIEYKKATSANSGMVFDASSLVGEIKGAGLEDQAKAAGFDLDKIRQGDLQAISFLRDHYTLLESVYKQGGLEVSDTVSNLISNLSTNLEEYEEAIAPVVDYLTEYANEEKLFADLPVELTSAFNEGIKSIAGKDLNINEMKGLTNLLSLELRNAFDKAKGPIEDADKALDQYARDLDELTYNKSAKQAAEELRALKTEAEALGHTEVAQWYENQASRIENAITGATESIAENIDTLADNIANAKANFDALGEGIEDYYSLADQARGLVETALEEKNTEGKGSKTFWNTYRGLASEDAYNQHDREKAIADMELFQKYFTEGAEGSAAFAQKLIDWQEKSFKFTDKNGNLVDKQLKNFFELAEDGTMHVTDEFKNLSDEQYAQLAAVFDLSADGFTAILNKLRQFGDLDFTDVEGVSKAIALDERSIKTDREVAGQQGAKRLYYGQSMLDVETADMESEAKENLVNDLTVKGRIQLPSGAENFLTASIDGGDTGSLLKQFVDDTKGTGDQVKNVMTALVQSGEYDKEGLEKIHTALTGEGGLLAGATDADVGFNDLYDGIIESLNDPTGAETNDILGGIDSTLNTLLGVIAAGKVSEGYLPDVAKQSEALRKEIIGGAGFDTWIQRFSLGQDENGYAITDKAKYNEIFAKLDQYKTANDNYINELREGRIAAEERGASAEELQAFDDEIAAAEENSRLIAQHIERAAHNSERIQTDFYNAGQTVFKGLADIRNNPNLNVDQKKSETADVLVDFANKLQSLNFSPETIQSVFKENFGIELELKDGEFATDISDQIKEQISDLGETEINAVLNIASIKLPGAAKGKNNTPSAIRRVGTMARGSKKKGYTINGEPTLTGELGPELVWEPRQNSAYMVGEHGPQFANLSKNAVVWNAEQTKRIKKNSKGVSSFGTGARGIHSFGTMALASGGGGGSVGGAKIPGTLEVDANVNILEVIPPKPEPEIPVKAKLEVEGNTKGGFLSKLFGGGKEGPSISVAANITSVNTGELSQTINVTGNITQLKTEGVTKEVQATAVVTQVTKSGQVAGEPVTVQATATTTKVKNETPAPKVSAETQTIKVTANTSAAQAKINQLIQLFNKTYTLKYKASGPSSIRVPISANFVGPWKKSVEINKSGAQGINNYIRHHSTPSFGSAAKGHYGTIGPKDNGGLTLTGEKGFEIAWLPSENRSMILGANGPQMLQLPSDAVIYTHEQSKKILKQKSIPAGSHADTTARGDDILGLLNVNSGGGGNGGNNSPKPKKTTVDKTLQKQIRQVTAEAGHVVVWWENMARRVESVQRQAEKNQKKLEGLLTKITSTTKTVNGTVKNYQKNLKTSIALSQREVLRANRELKALNTGSNKYYSQEDVSYEEKVNGEKKSHDITINLDRYIKYNKLFKNYDIDWKLLEQIGTWGWYDSSGNKHAANKSLAEAIKAAAEKAINDRVSKRNTAEDNVTKAREELKKLSKDIYDTFYGWETSLTKIWNITQKIETLTTKIDRLDAGTSLLEAQIGSGMRMSDASSAQTDMQLFKQRLNLQNRVLTQRQKAIEQATQDVKDATSVKDENAEITTINNMLKNPKKYKLKDTDIIGLKERKKALKEQRTVITRAKKYLTTTKNADGTVNIDFNYEKLNEDRLNGKITAEMAEAIEKYKDSIEEANNNLNEQRQALIEGVTEYYSTLKDLREQWADYEDQLIQITEENNKKELDQLKTLSDSVKQSLDDLLNDVKRKLDERRKQEDNANTERDISQKQQRLAMLRADTSGGHQVEIAQLEKEIAEAQQNYQRSLEDQLLEKLQNQADEAAKQRERQIELQEKIATSVNNIALVDMWMANPEQYREEIIQAYKDAQDYNEQGIHRQNAIDTDAEEFYEGVRTNQEKQRNIAFTIDKSNGLLAQIEEDLKWIGTTLANAKNRKLDVKDVHEKLGFSYKDLKEKGGYTIKDFFESKVSAKEARGAGFSLKELKDVGYNAKQLQKAEYTAKELKDAGFTMQDLKDVYTPSELKSAGFKLKDFEAEKFDYSSVRDAGFTVDKLRDSEVYGKQAEKDYEKIQKKYNNFLITRGAKTKKEAEKAGSSKFWGKLTSNGYNTMIAWGKQLGLTERQVATDLAKTDKLTWKDVIKAAKGAKRGGKRIKQWYPNAKKTSSFYKAFESVFGAGSWKKYASGGLATQTGPAWLDGTPSKPELVLNAADTKNFLALKDVLAGAMKGMSNTSNTYGDILYEININVDKIEKDYDVDRVVEKVKKEITKGAGYRNVTQVRNFR